MRTGFTFGKYLPFHKGHQALLDFALAQVDKLYVVVCASDREPLPVALRGAWIRETFDGAPKLQVVELEYQEAELANTSVASRSVSRAWAKKFKEVLPPVDVVITSEAYGDYVAEYLGIKHLPFDPARAQVPVSASLIRESVYEYWDFLPDAVKRTYQRKVVFLGTESTGKSSIAASLTEMFPVVLVKEAGRELIADSNVFTQALLEKVALNHAREIERKCATLYPLVLIDTDVHITQSYARYRFGNYLQLSQEVYERNRAHLYLYLTADLPFEQDGTRLDVADRNVLDMHHRQTLADFGISYLEVGGSWEDRLKQAETIMERHFRLAAG
jgi:HTH-type transcriptional repressor of NAD biosynthesis genes